MAPVLFTIGPFNAYAFGFFLAVSFVFATFIIWKYAKEELKEEEYLDIFLHTSIVALICARLVYIFFNFDKFGINILRFIVVREIPGLSMAGGLVGGAIFLYFYCKKKKYDFPHLVDIFSIAGSLALFFGKVGEQLGGAGFGKETNFILGVKIVGLTGRRHPTELYEAIFYLVLFIILTRLYQKSQRNKWPQGLIGVILGQSIAVSIFLIEFLKVNSLYLYGLNLNKIAALICLLILVKPLFTIIKISRQRK